MDSFSEPRLGLRGKFRSATREAILDAAAVVFAKAGAAHARVEDIAAVAGISVGTLYNHFDDRAAVVSVLLEKLAKQLLAAVDASSDPVGAAPVEGPGAFRAELERFVVALAGHFEANRNLLSLLLEEEAHRGIDATAALRRRTVVQEVLVRAERLMAGGIRTGVLQPGTAPVYAALLVGMVRGVTMSTLARPERRFADDTREVVRVFMRGAARPAQSARGVLEAVTRPAVPSHAGRSQ